jgi:hypothetical protein
MGEHFKADIGMYRFASDLLYLFKGKFSGKYNPGKTMLSRPENAIGIMDGQLGGGMEWEIRDDLFCERCNADVLHEDGIGAN